MARTLRYLIGSTLTDEDLQTVIQSTMVAAKASPRGITFAQYQEALKDAPLSFKLEVPTSD